MGNTVTPLGPISKLIDGTTGGVLAYIDAEGNEIDFSGSSLDVVIDASDPQFGGYWDGTNDDSSAIQAAVTYAATFTPTHAIKNVMLPPTVCIRSSIFVPSKVHIIGYRYTPGRITTAIKPHASMSLSTGFMFNMNTTDGTTAASSPALGQWWECGIFGVWLSNNTPNVAGARLALFCGTFIAHDIRAYRATQIFKKLTGEYIDNIEIRRVNSGISHDNTEYAIELTTGGGDAMLLEEFNFPVSGTYTSTPELGISITTGMNGVIRNCINGIISLTSTWNFAIQHYHSEYGYIVLTGANARISDSRWSIHNADSYYAIDCVTSGSNVNYHLGIDNCEFYYGDGTLEGTATADIRMHGAYSFVCNNSWRQIVMVSGQRSATGVRVNDNTDAPVTLWNDNSWFLSMRGHMIGNVPTGSCSAQLVTGFNGLYNTPSKITGSGNSSLVYSPNTTYYYYAQLILDSARANGRNQSGAEQSTTITAANTRVGMAFGWSTGTKCGIVRIYRGTSAGSYDNVVNIPTIGALYVVDNGTHCNGIPWTGRGAGAVDAITSTSAGTWLVSPIGKVAVA